MASSPLINQKNLHFLLHEVFPVEKLCAYPRFAEHQVATFDAVIQVAHDLALKQFLPHNRKSDNHEPEFDQGRLRLQHVRHHGPHRGGSSGPERAER